MIFVTLIDFGLGQTKHFIFQMQEETASYYLQLHTYVSFELDNSMFYCSGTTNLQTCMQILQNFSKRIFYKLNTNLFLSLVKFFILAISLLISWKKQFYKFFFKNCPFSCPTLCYNGIIRKN